MRISFWYDLHSPVVRIVDQSSQTPSERLRNVAITCAKSLDSQFFLKSVTDNERVWVNWVMTHWFSYYYHCWLYILSIPLLSSSLLSHNPSLLGCFVYLIFVAKFSSTTIKRIFRAEIVIQQDIFYYHPFAVASSFFAFWYSKMWTILFLIAFFLAFFRAHSFPLSSPLSIS